MLTCTIKITGKSLTDIEMAIEEATKGIVGGRRIGFDANDSSSFTFKITGKDEEDVEDEVA